MPIIAYPRNRSGGTNMIAMFIPNQLGTALYLCDELCLSTYLDVKQLRWQRVSGFPRKA